jgi:hypothetical protein
VWAWHGDGMDRTLWFKQRIEEKKDFFMVWQFAVFKEDAFKAM